MVGLVTQIVGAVSTGPRVYRDAVIDTGTLASFDFRTTWGVMPNSAGAVSLGAKAKNFVYGAEADGPIARAALSYAGGGVVFANGTAELIALPSGFMTKPGLRRFALVFWTKGAKPTGGITNFNNRLYDDLRAAGSNSGKIAMTPLYDNSGVATGVDCGGFNPGAAFLNTLQDGGLHQWGVEYVFASDMATKKLRVFLDGAVFAESGTVSHAGGEFVAPSAGDTAVLGRPANLNGSSLRGTYYRGHFHDLSLTSRTSDAMIAADYATHRARLAA